MYTTANNEVLPTSGVSTTTVQGTKGTIRTGTAGNDVFNSIAGDTLVGGLGDDTYNLWDTSSKVVEKPGEGIDTVYVQYWGGYQLPDNVENVVLVSKGANWATGNALNNVLIAGNTGATLDGGAGDDVLVGGAGADVFVIRAGNGSDAIDKFQSGWDTIKLQGYGFTSFAQIKAAATQVGSDVSVQLSATEKLVIHGVQMSGLQASDFNMPATVTASPAASAPLSSLSTQTMTAAGTAWNANGWYAVNNAWGSGALSNGKDYSLTTNFSAANMTKGTTFNWSYDVNTNLAPNILAFPEVIFGASPLGSTGVDPTDTAHVFPVRLSDLVGATAKYSTSFGGNVGGFDVAYDIFLSNSATATGKAAVSNEVMVWVHKGSFDAFGSPIGTYTNGSFTGTIYHTGNYTAIVTDHDVPAGTIDIADILSKLKDMGIVSNSEYLRSVELGSEVTGGTGTLTINDLSLSVVTRGADGGTITKTVSGSGTNVVQVSPLANALAAYVVGTQKTVDAYGYVTGTKTTTSDAQGALTVTRTDADNHLLGRDVVTHDATSMTVQHYTGTNLLSSTDRTTFASGVAETQHLGTAGQLLGADRAYISASGAEVTEHYDVNWKLISVDQTITKSVGVVEYQHYDANWRILSADIVTTAGATVTTQHMGSNWTNLGTDQVKTNVDGSTTVQHFGVDGAMTGADLVKVANGTTTTYHYDGRYALTGSDVTTTDATGVAKTLSFDAAYHQTGTTFVGTDKADTFYGWSGTTHFHGGLGSDKLVGGTGVDYFHFDTAIGQGDVDTISNFAVAQDKIVLDRSIFATLGNTGPLDPSMFVVGTKALDANDHIIFDKVKGNLYYDDDGNGSHQPILLAHVGADGALNASNFLVS